MMIAWYASSIIGSIAVTTNTRCIGADLTYFAEHSEAKICLQRNDSQDVFAISNNHIL